jgi:soluble lytic murein transglycosylase-like protein
MAEEKLNSLVRTRRFWILVLAIGLPLWAITLYSAFHLGGRRLNLHVLERNVQEVRAAMNVDTVRQHYIQKTMGVIADYNPGMPSDERYDIASEIYDMSIKYDNLDVDLLCATITHESAQTWRANIRSKAGAMGLMQVMPATGMFIAHFEGITWTNPQEVLLNPIYNIRIGARYLSTMISLYGLEGGLAAYNGGERRAALWVAGGADKGSLPTETRDYVPAVLAIYKELGG